MEPTSLPTVTALPTNGVALTAFSTFTPSTVAGSSLFTLTPLATSWNSAIVPPSGLLRAVEQDLDLPEEGRVVVFGALVDVRRVGELLLRGGEAVGHRLQQVAQLVQRLVVPVLGEQPDDAPGLVADVGLADLLRELRALVLVLAEHADVLVQRVHPDLVTTVGHQSSSSNRFRRKESPADPPLAGGAGGGGGLSAWRSTRSSEKSSGAA